LDAAGYKTLTAAISPAGTFLFGDFLPLLERAAGELTKVAENQGVRFAMYQESGAAHLRGTNGTSLAIIDAVFPVLHGPGGEDGTIQGLLESVGVPLVGAGTAASAMAMDKLAMKYLCLGAGIAQVEFLDASLGDSNTVAQNIDAAFGYPCFVKPANLGSSVGISRVNCAGELADALTEARRWDHRVLVERAVEAREIELALLGNDEPAIAPPGEIVSAGGFYDFDSKYVDDDAQLVAPAQVAPGTLSELESVARRVWHLIGCRGMARADFFVEKSTERVLFNEFNTIPGFTEISMYPRLWDLAGLALPDLVDRLVNLARQAQPGPAG
jgi:D-alanine-D-alanine ligase